MRQSTQAEFEAHMDRMVLSLREARLRVDETESFPGFWRAPLAILPRAGELARGICFDPKRMTNPPGKREPF